MKKAKIKSPKSKVESGNFTEIFQKLSFDEILDLYSPWSEAPYLTWEKVQYKLPKTSPLTKEEAWACIQLIRKAKSKASPVQTPEGKIFRLSHLQQEKEVEKLLQSPLFEKKIEKKHWNSQGLMHEAIASSQLEGATSSTEEARELLLHQNRAKNESEQMILNNYEALRFVEKELSKQKLSLQKLKNLHHIITQHTHDSAKEKPRLRRTHEKIFIQNPKTGLIYHEAPPMPFVEKELKRLLAFANQANSFTPLQKAITLHFWLGYLHPFTDGNGRLARQIFYWSMIRDGHENIVQFPLSTTLLHKAKAYILAYTHSEQNLDLNYFLSFNYEKILEAGQALAQEIQEKTRVKRLPFTFIQKHALNRRQIEILEYLIEGNHHKTNASLHQYHCKISKRTAIKDLHDLHKLFLLEASPSGRFLDYYAGPALRELFREKSC